MAHTAVAFLERNFSMIYRYLSSCFGLAWKMAHMFSYMFNYAFWLFFFFGCTVVCSDSSYMNEVHVHVVLPIFKPAEKSQIWNWGIKHFTHRAHPRRAGYCTQRCVNSDVPINDVPILGANLKSLSISLFAEDGSSYHWSLV